MVQYVVGFLFDDKAQRVALIEKQKPEWQLGRLNGIGGRIEPNETPHAAIVREFEEEAGITIHNWRLFCDLNCSHGRIHFFEARGSFEIMSKTSEIVAWYQIKDLSSLPILENLHWLIPLALDSGRLLGFFNESHVTAFEVRAT